VIIDNDSWSEELRLASTGEGPLTWLVGAYYFENERNGNILFDGFQITDDTSEVENLALFANVEYRLTENLSLSGGLRYDKEDRLERNNFSLDQASSNFEEVLPSISVSYKPTERLHFYGTVSRGYHAGGPNSFDAIAAGAPNSYDPEYVTNYELGIKGSNANASLKYDLAIFHMQWEDQQIQSAFTPLIGFTTNAGESEISGIEFSGQYVPVDGLSLSLSLSALDTEYTEYFAPISAAPFGLNPDLSGNELVYAADFSGNFSVQYQWPIGHDGWDIRLRGDINHVGKRPFDVTNLLIADAYTTVNFYAGIQNDRYEIGLYGNNVTDEDYLTGGSLPSLFFPPLLTVGDPSIFGLRLRARF